MWPQPGGDPPSRRTRPDADRVRGSRGHGQSATSRLRLLGYQDALEEAGRQRRHVTAGADRSISSRAAAEAVGEALEPGVSSTGSYAVTILPRSAHSGRCRSGDHRARRRRGDRVGRHLDRRDHLSQPHHRRAGRPTRSRRSPWRCCSNASTASTVWGDTAWRPFTLVVRESAPAPTADGAGPSRFSAVRLGDHRFSALDRSATLSPAVGSGRRVPEVRASGQDGPLPASAMLAPRGPTSAARGVCFDDEIGPERPLVRRPKVRIHRSSCRSRSESPASAIGDTYHRVTWYHRAPSPRLTSAAGLGRAGSGCTSTSARLTTAARCGSTAPSSASTKAVTRRSAST